MTMREIVENEIIDKKIDDLAQALLEAGFDFENNTIEIGLDGLIRTVDVIEHIGGVGHD